MLVLTTLSSFLLSVFGDRLNTKESAGVSNHVVWEVLLPAAEEYTPPAGGLGGCGGGRGRQ